MGVHYRVAILLASFNGEPYITDQIKSIIQQEHVRWDLWISDDGSEDGTLARIRELSSCICDVTIFDEEELPERQLFFLIDGPKKGVVANFYHLINTVYTSAFQHYDAFAFADQDDVWFSDKLTRALTAFADQRALAPANLDLPLLWCSEVKLCNRRGEFLADGVTKIPHDFRPSFGHALTQNIVRGNTCVFNKQGFELVKICQPRVPVVMHDWWFYLIFAGSRDGRILHEALPSLAYRQHDANQVGEANSLVSRIKRRRRAWLGDVRRWNDIHISALRNLNSEAREHLDAHLWQVLQVFERVCMASRTKSFFERISALRLLRQWKLRRLGHVQNIFMDLLVVMRRF